MDISYGIFVLERHQQKLLDRIDEINDGKLDHHSKEQVKIVRDDIIKKSKELQFAIDILKNNK